MSAEISEKVKDAYRRAKLYSFDDWFTTLADALRDERARANRAEFKLEHESRTHMDPRHTWTWEQWQEHADKELRG